MDGRIPFSTTATGHEQKLQELPKQRKK